MTKTQPIIKIKSVNLSKAVISKIALIKHKKLELHFQHTNNNTSFGGIMNNKSLSNIRKLHIKSWVSAATAASLLSANAFAIDYNDTYWNSPTKNTDFVDNFAAPSLNRNN